MPGAGRVAADLGLVDQRGLQLGQPADDEPGMVAQVQPQVGGDLVVAAAAGPQLAAERAEPLEQPALKRGVHVLVGDRRPEACRPRPRGPGRRARRASSRPRCRRAARPGAASARARGRPAGRSGRAASQTGRSATAAPARRRVRPRTVRPTAGLACPPDACSPDPICPTNLTSNMYRPRDPTLIEVRVAGGAVFRGIERTVSSPQRPSLIVSGQGASASCCYPRR